MSFRTSHEWTGGASIPVVNAGGAVVGHYSLATCRHCETLRVAGAGGVHFVRRAAKESDRVLHAEPSCVEPAAFFKAPW